MLYLFGLVIVGECVGVEVDDVDLCMCVIELIGIG